MSTTTESPPRPLKEALADAEAFQALFDPKSYIRWEFAGSVRRRRPHVSDIEHVIIPARGPVSVGGDLFGDMKEVNLLFHRMDQLVAEGTLAKHVYPNGTNRWGEKLRGVEFRRFNHEVHACCGDNWGSKLAIATGPADFSKLLVIALRRNGYANEDGYVRNRQDWYCSCGWTGSQPGFVMKAPAGEVPVCPKCMSPEVEPRIVPVASERAYFDLCGVAYKEPEDRV
jgi:DNA polymerase/3'-5' exonuclease PolX